MEEARRIVRIDRVPAAVRMWGETRSIFLAELAARQMGHVPLPEALGLVGLYARGEPAKYERAAVRWLGRLTLEANPPLRDVLLAASALQALPEHPKESLQVLAALSRSGG